jgi:hypothetical protein
LNKLGNEYIYKQGNTEENIEKVKKINIEQLKRFFSAMKK